MIGYNTIVFVMILNTYRKPAELHVCNSDDIIYSEEGTTQGDTSAMAMYACGLMPLVDQLKDDGKDGPKQVYYADDAAAAGKLSDISQWWGKIKNSGPKFGYYPKPSKSWLIVKPQYYEKAKEIFQDVQITDVGHRYLGSYIGSESGLSDFIKEECASWNDDIDGLCRIAKSEPQLAYAAFLYGTSKRWNYVARTTPNISDLLRPLEYKIKEEFIPAIVGKQYIPDKLRDIFGLPARMGGLGISNIQETAELEYTNSIQVTASLTEALYLQDHSYEVDDRAHNEIMKDVMKRKEAHYNRAKIKVADQCSDQQKRQLLLASEKGASSWLTSLPLKEYGFLLNKQEFHDALALRYNLTLTDLNRPKSCECGVVNTINHCLTCKLGGYVALRHDAIKETTASLLREGGCRDVQSEPMLLSVTTERLSSGTNTTDGARLDVSARSFWTPLDRAFTDIRVLNPQAQSNCVPIKQMYINHERQKKNMYMDRVLQVEKATFTPLVFSTTGGMGEEAIKFYKHLAGKISRKTNQEYPYVISYIRRKLRFVLLRTCIISLRGYRGKRRGKEEDSSELDLNLGPIIEHH